MKFSKVTEVTTLVLGMGIWVGCAAQPGAEVEGWSVAEVCETSVTLVTLDGIKQEWVVDVVGDCVFTCRAHIPKPICQNVPLGCQVERIGVGDLVSIEGCDGATCSFPGEIPELACEKQ